MHKEIQQNSFMHQHFQYKRIIEKKHLAGVHRHKQESADDATVRLSSYYNTYLNQTVYIFSI